jgi:PAS domain S-box-containing protein
LISFRSRLDAETVQSLLLSYSLVAGLTAIAFLSSILIEPWAPNGFVLLFLAATSLSSWYCRRGPGLASVALATLLIDYRFVEPKFEFIPTLQAVPFLFLFIAAATASALWLSSERHASREAILQSEQNFRLLVEGVRDYSIVLLDSKGLIATWNSGAERLQGYKGKEVIGRHFARFFPTGQEEHATEILRAAERQGRCEEEGPRVRKDGSTFWTSSVVTAIYASNGALRSFSVLTHDISDRRKIEEELQKQSVVSSIVESAPDAMIMVSEDATILLFNAEAEKLFGYSREEILGERIERLIPEPKRTAHVAYRQGFAQHPQTRAMGSGLELFAQRKDSSVVPVEVSLSPIRHFDRMFVISTIRDVSERRRTEKLLGQSRIIESAQVMVRELNGTIVHWTAGAERLYGYSRSEAIGSVSHDLLKTIFPTDLVAIESALRTKEYWEGELVHQKRDGTRICVSSYWILHRDEQGRPYRVLESSTDITGLKEAEDHILELNEQLAMRNATLEKANELIASQTEQIANTAKMSALGEMAGGIAHEINNPIGIIHARVNDLKEIAEESDTVPSATVIGTMEKVSNLVMRVAKITKSMRRFSRDAHQDPFHATTLDEILDDTLSFCQERFKLRSVALRLPRDAATFRLECRGTEIAQVLLNLLNNALDAIEALPEKWIEIEGKDAKDFIELSVTDSGTGIPHAVREKLGQPFFTTKEIGKGTGLGLSISRGIIESHGGSLTLDVDCPHTRFLIRLPKKPQSPTDRPAMSSLDTVSHSAS